jgi:hypothetical protein
VLNVGDSTDAKNTLESYPLSENIAKTPGQQGDTVSTISQCVARDCSARSALTIGKLRRGLGISRPSEGNEFAEEYPLA